MHTQNDDISSLRAILFETMRGVKDGSIDIEKAKAVNDIGQSIINSAKVEVDAMKIGSTNGSGFIPSLPATTTPQPGRTVHRLT